MVLIMVCLLSLKCRFAACWTARAAARLSVLSCGLSASVISSFSCATLRPARLLFLGCGFYVYPTGKGESSSALLSHF